ncbi:FKBP-type peptidyl-prolyl cis-trans isomerase [Roseateles saccharophilus]|uniref:FKBP-type peptidyl-prolyl cis-trans isomerase n=1 Tax=Roseateles saccharophilus TaxID=304 RepID=UPI00286A78E8|nr:FKBP-type peptidyl-prolyl cis-trans isomerase [Roseateles saccharophilus]
MPLFSTRRSALLLALSASLGLTACGGGGGDSGTPINQDPNGWNAVTTLKTTDTVVGTGATAAAGSKATVTYSGYLYDVRVADTRGTKFDAGSFQFTLGTNPLQVIAGFDQGVTGMKVGGKRTITMPASLGYGNTGAGNGAIPPGAALVFDVELTAVN